MLIAFCTGKVIAESAPYSAFSGTDQRILYVNVNATGERGEDGTWGRPFLTIQQAIDQANTGDTIQVFGGVYTEHLDLLGKNIHLMARARRPQNMVKELWPTIMGIDTRPIFRFAQGENAACHIEGFIMTHKSGNSGGAIYCHHASPTLSHCLIVGHDTRATQAAVITCQSSQAVFSQCTITDNLGPPTIPVIDTNNSPIRLHNSILWGNSSPSLWDYPDSAIQVLYCNIAGYGSGLDVDPLFVQTGQWLDYPVGFPVEDTNSVDRVWLPGDYHLQSIAGRWCETERTWRADEQSSPCIDAGDPTSLLEGESSPAGEAVNLGVYGATLQASKSYIDDQIVHFDNPFIKMAVEETLGIFDPTPADMLGLIELDAHRLWNTHIRNLTGLEYAINLERVIIKDNKFQHVNELAGLTNIHYLDISDCVTISDITGVTELVHLEHLDMHWNSVWNLNPLKKLSKLRTIIVRRNSLGPNALRPLASLPNLEHLDVRSNDLEYIDALTELTSLKTLLLDDNPWDLGGFQSDLEKIRHNNPGIEISY